MQLIHQLEYRSEQPSKRRGVVLPLVLLVVITGIIWALHELAIMPYRPPQDMSTFLGAPEEQFVAALIAISAAVWAFVLVWCVIRFRIARADA
jgi:hypothetical protein